MQTICYTLVKMKNKAKHILTELKEKYRVTDEMIAVKVSKSSTAIWRWRKGKTNPSMLELKLLERILRGYKNNKKK